MPLAELEESFKIFYMDSETLKVLKKIEEKIDLLLQCTKQEKEEENKNQYYFPWYNDVIHITKK